jgi:hypothetical protein
MGVDEHTLQDGQVWVCINNDAENPVQNAGIYHTTWCSALRRMDHVARVPKEATKHLAAECELCTGDATDSYGQDLVNRLKMEWTTMILPKDVPEKEDGDVWLRRTPEHSRGQLRCHTDRNCQTLRRGDPDIKVVSESDLLDTVLLCARCDSSGCQESVDRDMAETLSWAGVANR